MAKDDKDKAERLAAALRENLRRRKAQAREAQPKKDPTQPAKRIAEVEPAVERDPRPQNVKAAPAPSRARPALAA